MPGQQLTFALVFILLGGLLGWFSHSAYTGISLQSEVDKNFLPEHTNTTGFIAEKNNHEKIYVNEFSELLISGQYEKALLLFKKYAQTPDKPDGTIVSSRLESYKFILLSEIERLHKQAKIMELQQLLNVFLNEYYSNVTLLLKQAEIYAENGQYEAAISSYFQAKNYEVNGNKLLRITQRIHQFSRLLNKQLLESKNWPVGVKLFEQFIEYETEHTFYHFALANFHIKLKNDQQAMRHLQLLTNDPQYGNQASEILQKLYFNESLSGIELKKQNEHYLVSAILSDRYQVELMIDTGASLTTLSPELITRLVRDGLATKTGMNQLYTAGGQVQADIYTIAHISIGNHAVENMTVAELYLDSPAQTQNTSVGLLGMSFLKKFNFSIDQKNHKLLLSPK